MFSVVDRSNPHFPAAFAIGIGVVNNKSVKSGGGGYSCDTKHGNIGSDHEWEFLGSKICDFRGLW